ncbi:MAG: hypothetical protein ACOX79_11580 [Methanosarcina sp.]
MRIRGTGVFGGDVMIVEEAPKHASIFFFRTRYQLIISFDSI